MFKPVPRAAADQPDVIHLGMPIHNEVTVGSLLVLADTRLDQRSIFHRREAKSKIFAHALQRRLR